ncbi:hypothetical protein [Actinoallomurus rhizosphaericola]|uniref:hypothetical protein n=1 Tax=Actinoallomurus rhizosphaericola TaxID=2952536 RepID=UPI0020926196|nr:hypothetical protein [Actinoallomurus rhizosphaericola]MCO6000143.1 hypothetical protein [Actinoallomurus rhizosphaericola]
MNRNLKLALFSGAALLLVSGTRLFTSEGTPAPAPVPSPGKSESAQQIWEEAMGGGKPSDDLVVAERLNPNTGLWLQYTAGQERVIASTQQQCEVLLRRFKKGMDSRLPYDGKPFQWLCDSMPSVPGSAKPEDGWRV